ncbi:MAG: hypothetical protein KAJ28_11610 [Flavobacteriaceae bacterium]|nr:hypothetical protein [Flavobacteriaceae bacterium]
MIKFFRRIRQKLLTENKVSKYLLYAIGEILLVVIGILLALQVNNWNEKRKVTIIEVEFLKGLKGEMRANRDQMINVIEAHKKNIAAAHTIIQLFDKDISQISETVLNTLFNDLVLTWTYNPRMGKLNSIIMSGKLDYISNQELKSYLTSFHDEANDANEMNVKFLEIKYSRLDPLVDLIISRKNRFNLLFNDSSNTRSSFNSDYKNVFKSFEIENIINQMWIIAKFGLEEEEEHLTSINDILNLIDDKLED